MKELLYTIIEIISVLHTKLLALNDAYEYNFTDKQLHFIVIGIIGMVIFFATQALFKWLSKYSITAISFIYSLTVLTVIVFAIEIEQWLTKRGNMEFGDIVAGMNGFFYLFCVYLAIRFVIFGVKKIITIAKEK